MAGHGLLENYEEMVEILELLCGAPEVGRPNRSEPQAKALETVVVPGTDLKLSSPVQSQSEPPVARFFRERAPPAFNRAVADEVLYDIAKANLHDVNVAKCLQLPQATSRMANLKSGVPLLNAVLASSGTPAESLAPFERAALPVKVSSKDAFVQTEDVFTDSVDRQLRISSETVVRRLDSLMERGLKWLDSVRVDAVSTLADMKKIASIRPEKRTSQKQNRFSSGSSSLCAETKIRSRPKPLQQEQQWSDEVIEKLYDFLTAVRHDIGPGVIPSHQIGESTTSMSEVSRPASVPGVLRDQQPSIQSTSAPFPRHQKMTHGPRNTVALPQKLSVPIRHHSAKIPRAPLEPPTFPAPVAVQNAYSLQTDQPESSSKASDVRPREPQHDLNASQSFLQAINYNQQGPTCPRAGEVHFFIHMTTLACSLNLS